APPVTLSLRWHPTLTDDSGHLWFREMLRHAASLAALPVASGSRVRQLLPRGTRWPGAGEAAYPLKLYVTSAVAASLIGDFRSSIVDGHITWDNPDDGRTKSDQGRGGGSPEAGWPGSGRTGGGGQRVTSSAWAARGWLGQSLAGPRPACRSPP